MSATTTLYVEDLRDRRITRMTGLPIADVINGTFDWVYEEEFNLRDGFRWSPDGRSIAYWQLDMSGVPEFPLVNNTAGLYPKIQTFKYPKVGERNAAVTVGVVAADGRRDALARRAGRPARQLHRVSRVARAHRRDRRPAARTGSRTPRG